VGSREEGRISKGIIQNRLHLKRVLVERRRQVIDDGTFRAIDVPPAPAYVAGLVSTPSIGVVIGATCLIVFGANQMPS